MRNPRDHDPCCQPPWYRPERLVEIVLLDINRDPRQDRREATLKGVDEHCDRVEDGEEEVDPETDRNLARMCS